MTHTITTKDSNNRIVLITVSNPLNLGSEPAEILDELHQASDVLRCKCCSTSCSRFRLAV